MPTRRRRRGTPFAKAWSGATLQVPRGCGIAQVAASRKMKELRIEKSPGSQQ
jgi:hypothetical protein